MPITWENLEEEIKRLKLLNNSLILLNNSNLKSKNLSKISIVEINSYQNEILLEKIKDLKIFLLNTPKKLSKIKAEKEEAIIVKQEIEQGKKDNDQIKKILAKFIFKYSNKLINNNENINETEQKILHNSKKQKELKNQLKHLQEELKKIDNSKDSETLIGFSSEKKKIITNKLIEINEQIKEIEEKQKNLKEKSNYLNNENETIKSNISILEKQKKEINSFFWEKNNKKALLEIFSQEINAIEAEEKELKEKISFAFKNFKETIDTVKEKIKYEVNELIQQYSNLLEQKQSILKKYKDFKIQLQELKNEEITLGAEQKECKKELVKLEKAIENENLILRKLVIEKDRINKKIKKYERISKDVSVLLFGLERKKLEKKRGLWKFINGLYKRWRIK